MAFSSSLLAQVLGHQVLQNAQPALLQTARCLYHARHLSSSGFRLVQAQPQQSPQQEQDAASSSQKQQAAEAGSGNAEQASTSGAGPSAEELGRKVFGSFKSGFESVKSKIGDASASGPAPSHLFESLSKEVRAVFLPDDTIRSATRKYTGPVMDTQAEGYAGTSALAVVKQEQTAWDKVKEKLGGIPLFSRLRGVKVEDTAAFKKGQELVEDLKDKYETSDHPVVHKVEEVKEKLFTGSESGRAMREIRTRHPSFDLNTFVRSIKLDAPDVTRAFLKHDLEALGLHCGPELLQRLEGIFKHFTEAGLFEDPTILFVGDVEIVEIRMLDDDPFIIAQFHCQQLKCTRDKFGNVVEGSADAIQRVFYFWGLQQEKQGVVTADGTLLPPRWVIKDMMWQSMLALV